MGSLALLTWTFLWLSFLCVGGGLGVIPEMERQAVTVHHWLSAREFVDGYTLAQLTPGPNMLIAVFVAIARTGSSGRCWPAWRCSCRPRCWPSWSRTTGSSGACGRGP